jgi:hypothetical protein
MQYLPQVVSWLGISTFVIGFILLLVAAKGLARKLPPTN